MTTTTRRRRTTRRAVAVSAVSSVSAATPSSTAPPPRDLLEAYIEWLFNEHRLLAIELYGDSPDAEHYVPSTSARLFHFPAHPGRLKDVPPPATRAALVLDTVGVKWRATAVQS